MKDKGLPLLLAAAIWALSSAGALAQCTPDTYEEDDACIPSKTVIYGGDTQSHNFCQDAEDWLKFNTCAGRTYTIETSNLGTSADTVLELYGTDCAALLTSDNDGGTPPASKIAGWTAPADGTYHVKVLQNGGGFGDNHEYDITLTGDTSFCSAWAHTYSGSWDDSAGDVQQTSDGGFVVAATTGSFGAGGNDAWVLKLDVSGNVQWEKAYGGATDDGAASIQQTADDGFIVAGSTSSFGAGNYDFWVLKLSDLGAVEWQKTYGGTLNDQAFSVRQTADGGFVVAGWTNSSGAGAYDLWVLKLYDTGNIEWENTYGGALNENGNSIQQTADGGYIVAGRTSSFGADSFDVWVLKLLSNGAINWEKTYGGPSQDEAWSIQPTADGGFVVAGWTNSSGAGGSDFWVLKLDADGDFIGPQDIWQNTYGGASFDYAYSIRQTVDGGFVVAGRTQSFGPGWNDFWVLKLEPTLGGVTWQKTYSGVDYDASAYSVQQTADGGFAVAGNSFPVFDGDSYDAWVLKLDVGGNITPACPIVADTAVTGAPSSATVTDSTAFVAPAGVTPGGDTVTITDTEATVGFECAPYLMYDSHTFTDCGNADVVVDPGETVDLNVTVQNTGDADAFNVSGVLSTTTPGIAIIVNNASFPDIPAGLTGTSLTPFQFIVDGGVPCGTMIDFTLDLSCEGGFGNPFSNPTVFQVPVGSFAVPVPLLYTDFEDCADPPTSNLGDWTVNNNDDGFNIGWTHAGPTGSGCESLCEWDLFPTNYYVNDSNCSGWNAAQNDELISPVLDTSTAPVVALIFEHDFADYDGGSPAAVQVRAKSSNTGGAWVTLKDYAIDCPGDCASSGTQVLDATAECANAVGADCQIEFYNVTGYWDSWWWAVDNVVVRDTTMVCNPACCGLPYVAYDATFNPQGTLTKVCGDGDLVVEPGEEWQVTVQFHNFGCVIAKSTVADLTVNAGSAVAATVCNNSGSYGDIAAGGNATYTYSFVVDPAAVCVNDVTFDVTGIASDEGAYADEVAAFTVQVGQTTAANEVGTQFTDPLNASGGSATSDFAPAFTLAAPVASASLDWASLTCQGASSVNIFTDDCELDPVANGWTVGGADGAASSSGASPDACPGGGGNNADMQKATWIERVVDTTGYNNIVVHTDWLWVNHDVGECVTFSYSTTGLGGPWTDWYEPAGPGIVCGSPLPAADLWNCDYNTGILGPGANDNPNFAIRFASSASANNERLRLDNVLVESFTPGCNVINDARVTLIGPPPANNTKTLKNLTELDLSPYDVLAFYNTEGPGVYQIQLYEDSGGGTAALTGATMSVTAPDVTECDAGACGCAAAVPSEPSPPGSLDPLIIPTTAADQVIVEDVENETGYVVYEGAIGTWYGTPSQGCLAAWTDLGSTVQLGYPMAPGDRWVVVSAANATGESSCGMDSAGAERNAQPAWPAPGPCP